MSDAKFTPGPWAFQKDEDFSMDEVFGFFVQGGEGSEIVYFENDDRPETKANARLISAAPELLEALMEAEKHFGPFAEITINGQHDPDDVRVVSIMRAAIAKATGNANP